MDFFSVIFAIIKAVPTIGHWLDQLNLLYFKYRISEMKEENRQAIREAMDGQDQRKIENLLGSDYSGKVSGLDGTSVVDSLPNVSMPGNSDKKTN